MLRHDPLPDEVSVTVDSETRSATQPGPLERPAPRPSPRVISATHQDAMVLLDPVTGRYFTLNAVASCVWVDLCDSRPVSMIVDRIATAYDMPRPQVEADIEALLAKLGSLELLASVE